MTAEILFPLGVRLSTWLLVFAFASLAASRSDRRPLLACGAWLAGFEGVYQIVWLIVKAPASVPVVGPNSISLLVGMPIVALVLTATGARPDRRLFVAALVVFAVWVGVGFPVNTGLGAPVHVLAEVLNEATKILWAVAYLLPLRPAGHKVRALARLEEM